jgi:hypothetical protein
MTLNVTASEIVRTAPYALGQSGDLWAGRRVEARFELPEDGEIGIVDSYGCAKDIPSTRGQLRIYRSEGEDRAERPYFIDDVLTIDLRLGEAAFFWLWNEMQGRSGALDISVDFFVLVPDDKGEFADLAASFFIDLAGAEGEYDAVVGLDLSIRDRWGDRSLTA